MRFKLSVMVALGTLGAVAAQASECGEQIRLLDDRYSLRADGGPETPRPAAPADATRASGASGAASSSAGLDAVPNTGGVANPRNTPVERLTDAQRDRVREALIAAKRADEAGDGTTCAAKVSEARKIAQGESPEPTAK